MQQKQQAITVCAFIHHELDGVIKVFLAKRADTKAFLPGVFELPGGHVEWGEKLENALIREAREELGIKIAVGEPFTAFTYVNETKGTHSVEIDYFATFDESFEHIRLNPADHSSFVWVSRDEVEHITDISKAERSVINKGFEILSHTKSSV